MYHYVYMSYDDTRYYIGVRTSKVQPCFDNYLGSYTDKSFKPYSKIILSYHIDRKAAMEAERYWQHKFKVVENPLFANRAYQTTTGFSTYGLKACKETRKKLSELRKGKPINFTEDSLNKFAQHCRKINKELDRSGTNNGRYIETKFVFTNLKTEETIIETPHNFSNQTGLDRSRVSKLFKGKIHHYKQWVCSCILS